MALFLVLMTFAIAFALSVSEVSNGPWVFIFTPVVFGALFFWFRAWPCPRCAKSFAGYERGFTYAKCCQSCGLALWNDPGDVSAYRQKQQK
jgi:hypothetical protein